MAKNKFQISALFELLGTLKMNSSISLEELSRLVDLDKDELIDALQALSRMEFDYDYVDLSIEGDMLYVGNLPGKPFEILELKERQMLAITLALRLCGVPIESDLYRSISDTLSSNWGQDFAEEYFSIFGPAHSFEIFKNLAVAHQNSFPVEIEYLSMQNRRSTRKIDVAQMSIEREGWYVHGYDYASGELRTFKLSRITEVFLITLEQSKGHKNFGVFRDTREALSQNEEKEVVVRFKSRADFSARDWPEASSPRTLTTGAVEVVIKVVNLYWLANRVIELGGKAEVIGPKNVREFVKDFAASKLEAFRKAYDSSSNIPEA